MWSALRREIERSPQTLDTCPPRGLTREFNVALDIETRADMLCTLLARQIDDSSIVVMGTSTPLTAVATLMAISSHAPSAAYTSPLAGALSVAPHAMSLTTMEHAVYANALSRSAQIIDLWEVATINPRTAERWLQFFRPAQIDATGAINNSRISGPNGTLQLPGSVGISDMAAFYPRVQSYITRHTPSVVRERVDFVSAPGTCGTVEERERRGLRWGRPYRLLTDLCVMEFNDAGRMEVVSVHDGVSHDEVQASTGFEIGFRTPTAVTPPPSEAELQVLAAVDPSRLRDLEFVPSSVRRDAIRNAIQ